MSNPCDSTTCRDLAQEYLRTFRLMHPHMKPPSVVVLRDGRVLFNGFVLSVEDIAEMRANLVRWHQRPARLTPAN
jgi:hypothetical protein